MNFFKKGLEYNKLAQAFNGLYQMIQETIQKAQYNDVRDDLFAIAYVGRKEIIDRMDEYNWSLETSIVIPMMPGQRTTLLFAYQQTIGKLIELSEIEGYLNEIEEILDKGNLFFELSKTFSK